MSIVHCINGIRRKTALIYFCEGVFTISKLSNYYKKMGYLNNNGTNSFDNLRDNNLNELKK